MGTWGSKPFENDTAADFVGRIIDTILPPVIAFAEEPSDYLYEKSIAAVAMLNRIMRDSPSRPWRYGEAWDGRAVCELLAAYTTDNPHRAELEEFAAWTTPPGKEKVG